MLSPKIVAVCSLFTVLATAQSLQLAQLGIKEGVQIVTSIDQDKTGLLWIGSTNGLFSYDGQNFRRYAEADGLPEAQVGFVVSNKDTLWIATITGIARKEGDRFVKVFTLPAPSVSVIGNGRDSLYFLAPDLHILRDSKMLTDPTIRPKFPMSMSPQGDLWYPCEMEICQIESASLTLFEAGQLKSLPVRRFGVRQGLPARQWSSVATDKEGTIYASSLFEKAAWRAEAGKSFFKIATDSNHITIQVDRLGNSIFKGVGWIGRWVDGLLQPAKVPAVLQINTVLRDLEGTYWMGTTSSGLWRWKQSPSIQTIAHKTENALPLTYQTTRTLEGALLTSGTSAGVLRLSADSLNLIPFGTPPIIEISFVVEADLNGGAIAGYGRMGLVRMDSEGRIVNSIKDQDGQKILTAHRLRIDRKGVGWISTKSAFYRLPRGSNTATKIEIVPGKADYRDIEFASNGDIWVGLEKGLAQYHDGKWRVYTKKDGLKSDYIRCVAEDKQGNIWVGYRMPLGFAKITKKDANWDVRHFDSSSGMGSNSIFFLKVDSRGWIWRGTNDGVHISKTGSADPGDWLHLTTEDGLPHNDMVQFSFFEDVDKSVWFGTGGGPARVLPEVVENAFQSRISVAITNTNIEGATLSVGLQPIAFSHRDHLQYRYRLKPTSSEWSPHPNEKLTVSSIAYGNQTLEVQARRPGTQWSESATFDFTRPLPIWRRVPALVSYAAVVVGLLLWRNWRHRRFQLEKSLFIQIADLPPEIQRIKLSEAPLQLANRVRLLLAARSELTAEDSTGVLLNGRYRIEERIAQGGMATIYRARDERLSNRPTAIKILRPDLGDPEWLARRFEQERQALGRIQNPGVISVIDIGETPQGLAFLALEFVDGPTLRELLKKGPIDRVRTVAYMRQAANALQSAHDAGVTHRDLKPENLMIRSYGMREERLVIVDFGIAVVRRTGDATLVLSRVSGSIPYMAPEQNQGRITPACDIYALGLIVFEMITGVPAIPLGLGKNGDLPGAMRSYLGTQISGEAIDVLTSALRYDPAERPTSTGEWGLRLAGLLEQG